ncbi:MAG: TRAP transporter small permease [Planctomycetes bacterium]|nr:TRAP transporter small permease [Planctomycetota bacterium]
MNESHPHVLRVCRKIDRSIQQVEVWVCLVALAIMVLLAFAQVLLRQTSGASFGPISFPQPVAWFDNIARHMVIWVGVLGASLATAEGRHISIEAIPKLLGPTARRRVDVVVNGSAALACGVLVVLAGFYLSRVQIPNEAHLFIIEALDLKVYRWPLLMVVPVGLALMTWRFALRVAEALVLNDEDYAELRAEDEDDEPQGDGGGPEKEKHEQAPSAGDPTAVAEARKALSSSSWDERSDGAPPPPTRAGSDLADVDDLGDDSEEGSPLGPASAGDGRQRPAHVPSLRSTDEIPIYTDISDTEDLREPEVRVGVRVVDSSDELGAVYGMEDLVGDTPAETGPEDEAAMARSTDRMALEPLPGDSAPLGLGEAVTDRLARTEFPDVAESDAGPIQPAETPAADMPAADTETPAAGTPAADSETPAADTPADEGGDS